MWGYGLRIGEVLELKVKDLESPDIKINGKGGKYRLVPINKTFLEYIKTMIEERPFSGYTNSFIFLGVRGKKLEASIIQRLIRSLRKKLLLPENTSPHSLRHTFATTLLENMVDPTGKGNSILFLLSSRQSESLCKNNPCSMFFGSGN